jgi:hypothetical protein
LRNPQLPLLRPREKQRPVLTDAQKVDTNMVYSFDHISRVEFMQKLYCKFHKDDNKYESVEWLFCALFNLFGI